MFEGDYCGFPAVPVNGAVKMINATEYEYSCYDGFQYSGAHRITCDPKTGQWNPLPTCSSNIPFAYIFGAAGAMIALILVLLTILLIKR
jgi:Sushi repeat (SCR repeat)